MKLVPLSDRVVLKQCEAEETTKSGIILTSSAQEKPQEAEVIAVGPGGMVDGKEVTMQVKAGQKVIYSKYADTTQMARMRICVQWRTLSYGRGNPTRWQRKVKNRIS